MTALPLNEARLRPQDLSLIEQDMKRLEAKLQDSVRMGQENLDAAVQLIIKSGGKRMRPRLTFLVGRMLEVAEDKAVSVAASVEMLHTATLIHDDLVDSANERRGAPTLHTMLPLGITVLTGDFLFAQAAKLAAEAQSVPVVQLFSDTLVSICQGEILQAQTRWQVPSMEVYIERIYGKTAALFEAAVVSAALLSKLNPLQLAAIREYGRSFGLAFQIIDDALDFTSSTERLGKPAGHDMIQGHFNLPLMLLVQDGQITAEELVHRVENEEGLPDLLAQVKNSGAIAHSVEIARDYARRAVSGLSEWHGAYVNALVNLTYKSIERDF